MQSKKQNKTKNLKLRYREEIGGGRSKYRWNQEGKKKIPLYLSLRWAYVEIQDSIEAGNKAKRRQSSLTGDLYVEE